MDLDRIADVLRMARPDSDQECLSTCCALSVELLLGRDALAARPALVAGFGAVEGGATFANARVLLARLFSVRSDVVSGPLEAMLERNGTAGLVMLGVEPSLLYVGAAPGRHALLLAGCRTDRPPAWASGFLVPIRPGTQDPVTFVDPSLPVPPMRSARWPVLAAAFDRAGREGLLVAAR